MLQCYEFTSYATIATRLAGEPAPIKLILVKAVFLLVAFSTLACIWFVVGLLSVGILWWSLLWKILWWYYVNTLFKYIGISCFSFVKYNRPLPIRRFIVSRGSFIFSQPLETSFKCKSSVLNENCRSHETRDLVQTDILLARLSKIESLLLEQIQPESKTKIMNGIEIRSSRSHSLWTLFWFLYMRI